MERFIRMTLTEEEAEQIDRLKRVTKVPKKELLKACLRKGMQALEQEDNLFETLSQMFNPNNTSK